MTASLSAPPAVGTLHGVGVGPGDPELLTLRAVRIIDDAPVIAYPATRQGESMALAIVDAFLRDDQEQLALPLMFSPAQTPDDPAYDRAADAIATHLDEGRSVAVLCQGDPLFHGSFIYLLARLGDRYPVDVTPGVSSIMASAAAIARPLAHGTETLTVVPATASDDRLRAVLTPAEVAVVMKVGRHLPRVARILAEVGLADGALCVTRVGYADERVRPLPEALTRPEGVPYFTLVLARRAAADARDARTAEGDAA
ncbi:precorrin-2 C(20)-methyltransferase [Roseospira marina]|uniref:Precorrin-2 C(20)-methyltransferase n=1 Tax=Roseospira marina TaxID=140057 RepID=A0A5M6I766_9PROT|nr:precorrin-2 C(20)-methyltransferase [Roseospira marina]KAA5604114.1 precorrin-2 C(20)-methyltransferase [Roseospira marina]MBB4315783.1 precorrin-2/cobalt-factor-2 C20-methyltransferase [Roseospira marina]MBB5088978.1 precorrin-2/cobalt-factor-2 C20-methyltransferase [Roseospira marina]